MTNFTFGTISSSWSRKNLTASKLEKNPISETKFHNKEKLKIVED